MGIGKRLKEARELAGLTQEELGRRVGVTGSSITNYEKEVSHPKEPIMYKLINTLNIEPNYLFQDCVKIPSQKKAPFDLSNEAFKFAQNYEKLDKHGKDLVSTVLEKEYQRCTAIDDTVQLSAVARTRDGKALNMEDVPKFTRAQLDSMEKDLDDLLADGPEKLP